MSDPNTHVCLASPLPLNTRQRQQPGVICLHTLPHGTHTYQSPPVTVQKAANGIRSGFSAGKYNRAWNNGLRDELHRAGDITRRPTSVCIMETNTYTHYCLSSISLTFMQTAASAIYRHSIQFSCLHTYQCVHIKLFCKC